MNSNSILHIMYDLKQFKQSHENKNKNYVSNNLDNIDVKIFNEQLKKYNSIVFYKNIQEFFFNYY